MYGNPYFNPQLQPQRYPQTDINNQQMYIPQIQQPMQQNSLMGKTVDSVDVVKVMDIPLDGSVSYFPVIDGSAIVTKKLQTDGTSKITVYKPVDEKPIETPKYVTADDVKSMIPDIDLSELDEMRDELRQIRKQLKEIKDKK